jgi:hypothetical protein
MTKNLIQRTYKKAMSLLFSAHNMYYCLFVSSSKISKNSVGSHHLTTKKPIHVHQKCKARNYSCSPQWYMQHAGRTHQITHYADDNGALIDSGHHLQRRPETHHYPNSLYARSLFLSLSLSRHLASSHNLNGLLISWCSVEFFANVSASIIPSIPLHN